MENARAVFVQAFKKFLSRKLKHLIFKAKSRKIIKKDFRGYFMQEITGVIPSKTTPYSEFKNHIVEVV